MQFDHDLKSWPRFFTAIMAGEKQYDLRDIRDRDFKIGQVVRLREWDPNGAGYTGRHLLMRITYITDRNHPCALSSMALDKGTAILGLSRTDANDKPASSTKPNAYGEGYFSRPV